jgi:CubicO group peptidase (beta-lactamase class C family)
MRIRRAGLAWAPVPALDALASWPVDRVGGAVVDRDGGVDTAGDTGWRTRIASVTKPLVALACLVAVEEGTLDLEAPAGPPGSTVRHLLAHASGLPFEGAAPVSPPGRRRIYSNTGFDVLGDTLAAAAGMTTATYLHEAVAVPLGMGRTELRGSPGSSPASAASTATRGDWASRSRMRSRPTGRRPTARPARSATSAGRARSCGSTPTPAWPPSC